MSKEKHVTPCEDRGYKEGDLFKVTEGDVIFSPGALIELYADDGSNCPLFKAVEGNCSYNNADGEPGGYEYLDNVVLVKTGVDK